MVVMVSTVVIPSKEIPVYDKQKIEDNNMQFKHIWDVFKMTWEKLILSNVKLIKGLVQTCFSFCLFYLNK